jgi:hypothetical protein
MVRECRPPAREPVRSWLARRSTMATSTFANANSPASISPVGPPPAITTACSVIPHPGRHDAGRQRAHLLADRHQRHADTGQQLGELRLRAHRHLRAECPQSHRESHHRFDVPVRLLRRQRHGHFATPIPVGSGFGRHYAALPGACGKPPGALYTGGGKGTHLSTSRPLWTDKLLAKRRSAAYSDTQTPRNTSALPPKLITLLNPSICFRVPTRLAKQSMCDSNWRQNRVGQRRNRPRVRGIRLTYAE